MLLTTRQNTKLRNGLNNNSATDIKLSKTQIKKIIQSGGFLGKLLSKLAGSLMKVPIKINKFINNDTTKSSSLERIESNIFRIQAYDSIMCRCFCIEFINYMLKGKKLLDYTNLFSPNDFKNNDQVIKRIFKSE